MLSPVKKNINWLVIKEKNEGKKPCLKIENFRIKNVVALCFTTEILKIANKLKQRWANIY